MPQPAAVSDPLHRALIGRRRKRRFAKPDHRGSPVARAGTELEQVTDSVLAAGRDAKAPGKAEHLIDLECVVALWRRSRCRVVRARTSRRKDWP